MLLGRAAIPSMSDLHRLGDLGEAWSLDPEAHSRVAASYERLMGFLRDQARPIYGLHTHFGHNSAHASDAADWLEHQLALLRYLHVGVGPQLESHTVRRALRLQAYKMGLGFSGLHPRTFERLKLYADSPNLPAVPCHGSLGASGDLIPMAHAVRALFAQEPPAGPRDALALVNTNAMMASLAIDCWQRTRMLLDGATCGWLLHSEASGWIYPDLRLESQGWAARGTESKVREAWASAASDWQAHLAKERSAPAPALPGVQARYSLRCAPQILVDLEENLAFAAGKIREEALGLADNPIVLETQMWHGGLFYTAGLASAAELMQNAVVRLCDLMDRHVLLTVTPEFSHGLPTNLASSQPGDHVKGLHQLASALLQKIKGMSLPACLLSFSCESNNQDVVPASMAALLLLQDALALAEDIARVHLFVGERAWALRDKGEAPAHLSLDGWEGYRSAKLVAKYRDLTKNSRG